MFVPSNFKSALICNSETGSNNTFLLFKVAFNFAQKGILVHILSNSQDENITTDEKYLSHPEILQRIQYRYFKSSQEVLKWCHEVHYLHKKPAILIISLDLFGGPKSFDVIQICAALVDALLYLSEADKSKQFYLLAGSSFKHNALLPYTFNYFYFNWTAEITDTSVYLIPYNCEHESQCQKKILIDSDSKLQDFLKLFKGCRKRDIC